MSDNKKHICPNCDQEFDKSFEYCPHCGQINKELNIKLKDFVWDYLSANFDFDSKVFITLKLLLFKPAFLTKEYLKGRQTRYVPPVRLYLFISLLYFFIASLSFPNSSEVLGDDVSILDTSLSSTDIHLSNNSDSLNYDLSMKADSIDRNTSVTAVEVFFNHKAEMLLSKAGYVRFSENIKKYISTGMFMLLPIVALIFMLLFYKGRYYIEHLLFVIYLQSTIFLYTTGFKLIETVYESVWLNVTQVIVLLFILFLWIRNFYELKIGKALWKTSLFLFIYITILTLYLAVLFFVSFVLI